MNWTEISEKYSKAWGELCKWIENKYGYTMHNVGNIRLYDRELYDFFDKQGVWITVWHESDDNTFDAQIDCIEDDEPVNWYLSNNKVGEKLLKSYDSRTEAEEAAFLQAFKILEDKLNQ